MSQQSCFERNFLIVELGEGASDDGSGVVILLELLSNLINDNTITFSDVHLVVLFTGGEEMGSLGAKAFVTSHVWRSNICRFINIDAATCHERAMLLGAQPSQVLLIHHCSVLIFVSFS